MNKKRIILISLGLYLVFRLVQVRYMGMDKIHMIMGIELKLAFIITILGLIVSIIGYYIDNNR